MPLSKFNTDDYVAHYTTLNIAVKYILETNKIKINSIERVNDPYEHIIDWIDTEPSVEELGYNTTSIDLNKIRNKIKRNIKIFATTTFRKNNTTDISNEMYCRPRMWAQYGDNNQGVCLIFNKKELNEEFKYSKKIGLISGNIEYYDFIPMINNTIDLEPNKLKLFLNDSDLLYKQLNSNEQLKSRFFIKHNDWKSEDEYRWLLFSEDSNDFYIDFNKSLKAIVFGSNVHDNYKTCLNNYNIPKYDLYFANGKYMANKI